MFEKGIYFVQDLLNTDGKFLPLENIQRNYNVQLNYLKYFQLIAAIPIYLKRKAQATAVTNRNIFEEWDTSYLSENEVISLTTVNVDVKITTNYFRKKLGQSLPLLKDGVDIFQTLTLVGKRSCTKFTKQQTSKS